MDLLQVKGNQIVNADGSPVRLRGTCVGGWMNMEDFINGFPGVEHHLRTVMAETLGWGKAQFFFDRLLDNFLAEDDIAFIQSTGANTVRLSLNYRHFEDDAAPFKSLEAGFARLDQMLSWCEKHSIYAILDMHAVPGWQNPDWHCDNACRQALFWAHPHFQTRLTALWEEFTRRYQGRAVVAGYNIMNEPVSNAVNGLYPGSYRPNWPLLNQVYRRLVNAIRKLDADHIIFLEGDLFSSKFAGLEAPFAPNLVYSSHNYSPAGFGPGAYPGEFIQVTWDRAYQSQWIESREGVSFTRQHNVPLWVGEFGSVYNGAPEEIPDRLRAMHDQLDSFEAAGLHWTTWTYKDVGVMSWQSLHPESEYMQLIKHVLKSKLALSTDSWMGWLPQTPAKKLVRDLAGCISDELSGLEIDPASSAHLLSKSALSSYAGELMQPAFARCFKDMSEARLDAVLQSFALKNCVPNRGLLGVLDKHLHRPA